jgi:hypothetical protein
MKKIAGVFGLIAMLVLVTGFASACSDCGNRGAIWTTVGDCGNSSQDVNHYAIGEDVYINGAGFCHQTYNWAITGNPGGSSGDPGAVVANGSLHVDSSGKFCFKAYTVQTDDWGEYKADFGNKGDNYRVDETPVVPEFGTIIGILTALSALGLFFVVRRK